MEHNDSNWKSTLPVIGYSLMIIYYSPHVLNMFTEALENASWHSFRPFVISLLLSVLFFVSLSYHSKKKEALLFRETPKKPNNKLDLITHVVKFIFIYLLCYYLVSQFLTPRLFSLIGQFYSPLLYGIMYTILVSISAIILGTLLGSISAYFSVSYPTHYFTQFVNNTLVYIFLAIPALVLIQLTYYNTTFSNSISNSKAIIIVSIIALSVNLSPFVSKILTSSLKNIPVDQINSAKTFGFSNYEILKKFKLPFVIKHSLQPLLVEYYTTIKLSSLTSVLGLPEAFHTVKNIIDTTGYTLSGYVLLSMCYMVLVIPIAVFANYLEGKIRNYNKI